MNKKLFVVLIGWQVMVLFFASWGVNNLVLQTGYLGTSVTEYTKNPLFWFHSNFDGVHYVEIAKWGYKPLLYFFFPLYPYLIQFLSGLLHNTSNSYVLSGQIISIVSFFAGVTYLHKLLSIDYKKNVIYLTLALILLFPTSFYLTSVYTESLFFALSVISIYFARRKRWFLSSFFGGLASLTRIVGITLFLAVFLEWFDENKKENLKTQIIRFLPLLLIPLGLLVYLRFLSIKTGDPLIFLHNISIYGAQRSSSIVLLPQVFYRYLFKIIPNSLGYLPMFLTIILEFLSGTLFLILTVISFFKIRRSYALYALAAYLIPTFSGSFSSMPRYVLVLFPSFLMLSLILKKRRFLTIFTLGFFAFLLAVFTAMFAAGYWIS